jgi:hypothetical protein
MGARGHLERLRLARTQSANNFLVDYNFEWIQVLRLSTGYTVHLDYSHCDGVMGSGWSHFRIDNYQPCHDKGWRLCPSP